MISRAMARHFVSVLFLVCVLVGVGHADMLNNAQAYLASTGVSVPPGYSIRWGSDTSGAAGQTKPTDPNNPAAGGVIVINPEGIKALSPSQTGDVTQHGGVIVAVLYHEIQHANGTHGPDICDEIRIQYETAGKACELVCLILDVYPGANVTPLCRFYHDTQNRYNNGVSTSGGAPAAWTSYGCTGTFPGLIPDCSCCP